VLRRRWLVVLVGLICLAAGGVAVVRYVPTEYQASGQLILLLPSTMTPDEPPKNPYLNLPDELTTTASLLASGMMTKDSQRALVGEGFESEYDVAVVPGVGPVLIITSKDTDPVEAIATRDQVMSRLETELQRIQVDASVPRNQLISATPSSVGESAEALPGSKVRALVALVGVGGTLIMLAAFLVDRRKRRKEAGPVTDERADAVAD
jgi:hypothetical protein